MSVNLIGLAKRAGKAICDSRAAEDAIKSKKAKLVIIASDASDGTRKALIDCCTFYNIKFVIAFDKQSIGKITGTDECSAVAVTDKNFADGILSKVTE